MVRPYFTLLFCFVVISKLLSTPFRHLIELYKNQIIYYTRFADAVLSVSNIAASVCLRE